MTKIYTRTGDKGKTSLIGGTRVSKSDLRLDTYGTIDELNSVIGLVISHILAESAGTSLGKNSSELVPFLRRIQSDLFDIGSHLACENDELRKQLPLVHEDHIRELEVQMDEFTTALAPLKNFILPGGSLAASATHLARTVCRRAERLCVRLEELNATESATDSTGESTSDAAADVESVVIRYINRLSDFLFVMARHLNRLSGDSEILWAPRPKP